MKNLIFFCCFVLAISTSQSQSAKQTYPLQDTANLKALNVAMQAETFNGKKCVKISDLDPAMERELRIVKLPDTSFHNGTIEVELAGEPMKNSFETARGFVGIAFRMDGSDTKYECIYLRPTNGRAEDQVRRNHSVQYISYPNYPWHKLREEFPKKYETYVDLEPGKWTKMKIEVNENAAKLFVHGASQPTLIVSDLKHGENVRGCIGLWIGPGTDARFRNLVVTKSD